MSTERICGTGGWDGPKPGDPDNNIGIQAVGTVSGIRVTWGYPGINPHAVAHGKLYRSNSSKSYGNVIAIVNGSTFFDSLEPEDLATYYYWIELVSVNGTVANKVGPAFARAESYGNNLYYHLQNKIDSGLLATTLRLDIDRIGLNALNITQEMIKRAENDDALAVAFNELRAFGENTQAVVQEEIVARTEQNAAFVDTVNTVYTEVQGNYAAIQEEKTARIKMGGSIQEAFASSLETTQSSLGENIASVETNLETNIKAVNEEVEKIGALYTAKVSVNGLVGGFGVYNDGTEVEAGFDVDRFWVGRSSDSGGYYPFIIDGSDIVFNGKVTFGNVRGAGTLASKNSLTYSELDGQVALDVKDNSIKGSAAKGRVDSWTKTSTTMIDGGVIRSDEAWVGELFIKNQAVTIPIESFTRGNKSLSSSDYLQFGHLYIPNMHSSAKALITVSFRVDFSFDVVEGEETVEVELTYSEDSSLEILWESKLIKTTGKRGHINISATRVFNKSGDTVRLKAKKSGNKTGSVAIGYRNISVIGAKK